MAVTINASTSAGLVQTADLSGSLQLQTAGTTAVTVNSSQNVGIGTTSPTASLSVAGANIGSPTADGVHIGMESGYAALEMCGSSSTGSFIDFSKSGSDYLARILCANSTNFFYITNLQSGPLVFSTANVEAARIDASGNLLVGGTSGSAISKDCNISSIYTTAKNGLLVRQTGSSASSYAVVFENSNGTIGTIVTNGSATTYNTSSDYRLKENVQPMVGALATVAQLKPVTYNWKVDGSNGQGFIAHELQEVVPDCVTGDKDAVDEEGNPKYQGIDTSFLVATLTKAIQELNAKVEALEAQLGAKP
jgi:hypothetical protein